jgi:hypothetical protein
MEDCHEGDLQKEIQLFKKMIREFKNPVQVSYMMGRHLILNGKDIWLDIQGALRALKDKDYRLYGNDVG